MGFLDELSLVIRGDAHEATEAAEAVAEKLNHLREGFHEVDEKVKESREVFRETFEAILKGVRDPMSAIESLGSTVEKKLVSAFSGAGHELEGFIPVLGVATTALAGAGVAAVSAGTMLFELAEHAAETAEQVEMFHIKTGIAFENIGALKLATEAAGGSLGQLGTVMRMLTMRMNQTGAGADKMNAALKDMGIESEHFRKLDFESQLFEMQEGFHHAAEKGNAAADATALLGRAGLTMLPILDKLSPKLVETAGHMAAVWDEETVEKANQFNIDLGLMKGFLSGIADRIGISLIPAFEHVFNTLTHNDELIHTIVEDVKLLTKGLLTLGEFVVNTAQYMWQAWNTVKVGLAEVGYTAVAIIERLLTVAKYIIPGIRGPVEAATGQLRTYLAGVRKDINATWESAKGNDEFAKVTKDINGLLEEGKHALDEHSESLHKTNLAANKAREGVEGVSAAEKKAVKITEESIKKTEALWSEYEQFEAKASGDSLAAKLAAIDKWEESAKRSLKTVEQGNENYWQQIEAIDAVSYAKREAAEEEDRKKREKQLEDSTARMSKMWDEYYKTIDHDAGQSLKYQLDGIDQWYDAQYKAIADRAKANADSWQELDALNATYYARLEKARNDDFEKQRGYAAETQKLWQEYYQMVGGSAKVAEQQELQAVENWKNEEIRKLKKDEEGWQDHYNAIVALAGAKMDEVRAKHEPVFAALRKLQDDMTTGWVNTFQQTLVQTGSFTKAFKSIWDTLKDDLKNIAASMLTQMVQGFLQPFMDATKRAASNVTSSLMGILTGNRGGGSGGGGLGGILGGLFGGGGRGSVGGGLGQTITDSIDSNGNLVAVGTGFGGKGLGGLLGKLGGLFGMGGGGAAGTAGLGASLMGSAATMGISLAIPFAIKGISALTHIGKPSKEELAGRSSEADFEKSFGGFQGMMDAVGKAYASTGKTAAQAQADVKAMFDAEKKGPEAVTAAMKPLLDALAKQKGLIDGTDESLTKYGLTWKDLGATVRQQHVDGELKTLQEDMKGLIADGIDNTKAVEAMSGAYSQYVQDAIDSNSTIPESMKPILQQLIDMGKLVDANGEKITDMSKIAFSNLETAAQTAANAAQKALDGIKAPVLKPSIDTSGLDMNGNPYQSPEGTASVGGRVTAQGIEHWSIGGIVGKIGRSFMGSGSALGGVNAADRVLAMLAPGEAVLNQGQQGDVVHSITSLKGSIGSMADMFDSVNASMLKQSRWTQMQIDELMRQKASWQQPQVIYSPKTPYQPDVISNIGMSQKPIPEVNYFHDPDWAQTWKERGGVTGDTSGSQITTGDINLKVVMPDNANVSDPAQFAHTLKQVLRTDMGAVRTAIEGIADERIGMVT